MRQKKAAVELSISTIVIIVLAMSMLILGIILVKNIFSGATEIADMSIDQVKNQVAQLFGENKRLVTYPDTRLVKISQGEVDGFGIGMKNLISGASAQDVRFSYEVVVSDPDLMIKCGVSESEVSRWIVTGRAEDQIALAPGEFTAGKVLIEVPEGASLCTFRLRINVRQNNQDYASDFMDVTIEP